MAGELTFFELGVGDVGRGRAFYEALFGWQFEPGPSGQGFTIATRSVPGGIHGGNAGATPYVFFSVADMDDALARVRDLGGSVEDLDAGGDAESAESIERFGRFKFCRDDQGSPFGLHQPPAAG